MEAMRKPLPVLRGVVGTPDSERGNIVKAYIVLAPGHEPTEETALSILSYARENLSPWQRVRRIEFAELPKTISGKIRRVELRAQEADRHGRGAGAARSPHEFWEDDLPELKP
jgi:acetyl-CoA synthetase